MINIENLNRYMNTIDYQDDYPSIIINQPIVDFNVQKSSGTIVLKLNVSDINHYPYYRITLNNFLKWLRQERKLKINELLKE